MPSGPGAVLLVRASLRTTSCAVICSFAHGVGAVGRLSRDGKVAGGGALNTFSKCCSRVAVFIWQMDAGVPAASLMWSIARFLWTRYRRCMARASDAGFSASGLDFRRCAVTLLVNMSMARFAAAHDWGVTSASFCDVPRVGTQDAAIAELHAAATE